MEIDKKRTRILKETEYRGGGVLYWMSRDQRVSDNYALLEAARIADEFDTGLTVCFALVPEFSGAALRQYDFMLQGLEETEKYLNNLNIPFFVLPGNPPDVIAAFAKRETIEVVVTDFDPLRIKRNWKKEFLDEYKGTVLETDAHNIVPALQASGKLEYAAYTIRPKIQKLLPDYLEEFPELSKRKKWRETDSVDWKGLRKGLRLDGDVLPVDWLQAGEQAAHKQLLGFLEEKIDHYADERNDPNKDVLSGLSPYLHFGQISAQRIALQVKKICEDSPGADAFLEELIIRRELADNFCYYNEDYDSPEGFHRWAKETIKQHRKDEREYLYSLEEFENAETHDPLWNAAQLEMNYRGKMHGFMRMYWAKKILEWTKNVEQAMQYAIYLNDKYELDGRDPNGYAGIAWAIGGVHDRAWQERPVFGKIRYMNYNGCKRKFDINAYIHSIEKFRKQNNG